MAVVSATNLLTSHTLYTLMLSYFLLTNPARLTTAPIVGTLGSAMQLPRATVSDLYKSEVSAKLPTPVEMDALAGANAATSLSALFLAFYALSDLVNASLPTPAFIAVWSVQAPVRLAALFALAGWIYFSRSVEDVIVLPLDGVGVLGKGVAGWLVCDVVFSWVFVELVWVFWVFVTVREERLTMERGRKDREDKDVRI